MVGRQAESKPDNWALSDMTLRRAEIIDEVCERLALGETLSRICAARDLPDRRTINRWAVKDRDLADRILTARRLGGWAMFDEATDRLMNATPQTIQVERELLASTASRRPCRGAASYVPASGRDLWH